MSNVSRDVEKCSRTPLTGLQLPHEELEQVNLSAIAVDRCKRQEKLL